MDKEQKGRARRRNVILPERTLKRLATLRDKTEASSDTEVMRKALQFYEQFVEDVDNGKEILVRDGKTGETEIVRLTF